MGCEGSVMEDPDNEYDSTWDDEAEGQRFGLGVTKQQTRKPERNLEAARDMQMFRQRCQMLRHAYHSHGQDNLYNLYFYQNRIPFHPHGVCIEDFHKDWFGDYTRLERVHSYIQWVFPTQEPGVNTYAHVLTPIEIKHFCEDTTVKKRLLKSYKLMLDFYGIRLINEKTGEVQRANNWRERFENLNRNRHNNLRITRILKCLGLLGFRRYQAPLVYFFLKETLIKGTLPHVKQSALDYFIFAVLDKYERKQLIKFAFSHFEPKEQFVWCPDRIQRKYLKGVPRKEHPSQTSAVSRREVMHHQVDYRTNVHNGNLYRSQNSTRNKMIRNAGHSKSNPTALPLVHQHRTKVYTGETVSRDQPTTKAEWAC